MLKDRSYNYATVVMTGKGLLRCGFVALVSRWREWLRTMVCLGAFLLLERGLQADVVEAWVHRYSNAASNSTDQIVRAAIDLAGDVIVSGSTEDGINRDDILTIKYSGTDGSVIWQMRHDSPEHGIDRPRSLAVDSSGDVLVAGLSFQSGYTVKYAAASGNVVWEKRGPHTDSAAMAVDAGGNVVVTGSSRGTNGLSDLYTVKYSGADGSVLWHTTYNGTTNGSDFGAAVTFDSRGDVLVTGRSAGGRPNLDLYTVKYAGADGALL
jgi:hypothetical protein